MNSLTGKSTGIALLMAAALITALFAMGIFSATGVSALVEEANDPDTVANESPRAELSSRLPEDTGVTLTAKFQVTAAGVGDRTADNDDIITVLLPTFLSYPTGTTQEQEDASVSVKQLEPEDVGDAVVTAGNVTAVSNTEGDGSQIQVTINPDGVAEVVADPDNNVDAVTGVPMIRAGADVIVTVTGLVIDGAAASGDVVFNQMVDATTADADDAREAAISSSVSSLTPKTSSDTPGAPIRLDIKAYADNDIRQGEDITVELKGFGVPSSVSESAVLITALDESAASIELAANNPGPYVGAPDVVTVSGDKITISLASRYQNGNSAGDIGADSIYTVTFKQSAGITNPTTRGTKGITLKDRDTEDGYGTIVIKSKVTLSADFGPRGTDITVTAKGIGKGGATVYLIQGHCADEGLDRLGNACPETDTRDISLGTGTSSGGGLTVDVETSSNDFDHDVTQVDKNGNPASEPFIRTDKLRGLNQITVVDGTGTTADVIAYFGVTPTISADSDSAQQGDELTIIVEDWYYGNVAKVTIGDELATDLVPDIDNNTGDGEIEIRVPNTARLGEQELKVVGSETDKEGGLSANGGLGNPDAAKGSVIIGALDMELDPSTVVLGQQFTVKVKGFSDDTPPTGTPQEIQYVEVGDFRLEETTGGTDIDKLSIDTNGDFTDTFNVKSTFEVRDSGGVLTGQEASDVLTPGTYRVEVKDWSGRLAIGRITFPEPEITIDPPVSRRGTTVTIVGKNFPAGRVVSIFYDKDDDENLLTAVLADSIGQFRDTFTVPSNAEIGDDQDIIAKSQANETQYKTKASHALPEQELVINPTQASAGGRLTIEGHNMPLFTLVDLYIADINVSGRGVETDGLGSFTVDNVLVPQLKPGTHTVEARVATQGQDQPTKVRTTVEIVDIITRDSDEAFEELIENGTLTRVWHLEPATQGWTFYDPNPDFADFNSLTEVSSGQIVTIIMNATDTFQGRTLYPESNPHVME